ncbi:maleylpyruvate isomerase N-terminal domain-containing protein [Streptomyces sp. SP17BM10]|uniref:maleylpyruvate isomerase N-terminal domain-containing protein n=1 Tax=Streptomyces sp. SP17BM10 TaxID=3002530 RepID=UPI002E76FEE8|nr:maleylpyruvate isomerase N-terminal domain-containing protein [Streptomyces sp. SP17BM10]MEE1786050.1 maleylpyruvate isomerase N-terminal domain-containing protein [Streptomyces sp. SP17BM10]
MTRHIAPTTEVLAEAWLSWAERGKGLDAEAWARPTRLPDWTVLDLFAHVAPTAESFGQLRAAVVDGPAEVESAAAVLRFFNQPGGLAHTAAGQVAEGAKKAAAETDPAGLIARFEVEGPAALAGYADLSPDTVAAHPILGAVRIGALAEVALMEATVHLLDLIAAVGGPPPADAALHAVRALLAEVADPVAFIEAASGRSDAAVLPVIR